VKDLADKLTKALNDEERIALAALFHPGKYDPDLREWIRTGTDDGEWRTGSGSASDACRVEGIGITIYDEGGHTEEQAAHIAFQDPARALRRVAAHRKILEIHKRHPNPYNANESACQECDEYRHETDFSTEQACPTVLALAEEYDLSDDSGSAQISRIVEEEGLPY
jgi:sRNA-binding protein